MSEPLTLWEKFLLILCRIGLHDERGPLGLFVDPISELAARRCQRCGRHYTI